MLDAGVVDEDVAASGLGHEPAAILWLAHVGGDIGDGHAEFGRHVLRQLVILVPVGEGVQDDVRPGPGQGAGDAQPDARIGSRDDGGLAGQSLSHDVNSPDAAVAASCHGSAAGAKDQITAGCRRVRRFPALVPPPARDRFAQVSRLSHASASLRRIASCQAIRDALDP